MTAPLLELRERLSRSTRQYLDLELTKDSGTYAAVASVATGCIRAGLTDTEFVRVVEYSDLGSEIQSSSRIKTRGQFLKFITSAWDFAEDSYNPGYFDDSRTIRQQLEDLLHRIRTGAWTGRSANTDRAVSAALVTMCLDAGGNAYSVHASTRQLSEVSGVPAVTVSDALPRIRASGLIKSVKLRGKGLSRSWVLDLSWSPSGVSGVTRTDVLRIKDSSVRLTPTTTPTHECFIGKGSLGQSSARVWDWLANRGHEATVAEIRSGTGLSEWAVRRHVARMVDLGMMHKQGDRNARYSIAVTADLDAVAEQLGSAGWRDRRRERHAADRKPIEPWVWDIEWPPHDDTKIWPYRIVPGISIRDAFDPIPPASIWRLKDPFLAAPPA